MTQPKLTETWHDANGFPHSTPQPVPFSMEEADTWECTSCDTDVNSDVDKAGHRYDGPTARQIWTACPLAGEGDGDVFTGAFDEAFAYFVTAFSPEPQDDKRDA